jgi:hypothetical protein
MINKFLILASFLTASFAFTTYESVDTPDKPSEENPKIELAVETSAPTAEEKMELLYESFLDLNASMPSKVAFTYGLTGYEKLQDQNKIGKEILTIVDFSLPSTEKRMWIMDMTTKKVLFNTYVSHGKNTGGDMATKFSNTPNSFQSSLGFYVTAETYYGKNGLSLFIDGMEKEFNSNARSRYVVIHGADYATEGFINRLGRLGRSYGCPAVPRKISKEVINTIKGQSGLFIYHPDQDYISKSSYLNPQAV